MMTNQTHHEQAMPHGLESQRLIAQGSTPRRTSRLLAVVGAAALLGSCLLTSPPAFSKKHHEDTSLLNPVVTALAMGGNYPTVRGVEIRNLLFYSGAAVLLFLAGIRLAMTRSSPKMTMDDLFDLRSRAGSPLFWWGMILLVSVVTSTFAHAPAVCKGQVIIRFLHFAWWIPLAFFLLPHHVRGLLWSLLAAVAITAGVGIWYYIIRVIPDLPGARLKYPIGNELWFGACLLPAVFVAFGLATGALCGLRTGPTPGRVKSKSPSAPASNGYRNALLAMGAASLVLIALYLTRSRSAQVGLLAGLITLVFYLSGRKLRPVVVLVGLAAAICGVMYVQHLRVSGGTQQRAHSIRSRLDHEWPYALTLFFQKPVGGNGEGCYAMLAGQYARMDQLDDPAITASDAHYWTTHAHNEILERLADVGLTGTIAFILAIAMTLIVTLRYVDRLRGSKADNNSRWLAMSLAAALVAMLVEECSDVAIRQPGFPPIFLTVWAVLWALVRDARPQPEMSSDAPTIHPLSVRLLGIGMGLAAVVLGYWGVQDWRAARARFETETQLSHSDYTGAIQSADFAAAHALDPFQKLSAQLYAVQARSGEFERRIKSPDPDAASDPLEIAHDAWIKLSRLNIAAPRFLGLSRLAWELSLNMAHVYRQRGQNKIARDYTENYLGWLEQNRKDEPFTPEIVQRLWRDKPGAGEMDRLLWLRCLLRRGEMDRPFLDLVQRFGHRPGSMDVMNDLLGVAQQDLSRPVRQWRDRLSPETFRIAALARDWSGQSKEAAIMAQQADAMYEKSGPRLFASHAAAVHEFVRYRFHHNPTNETDELLSQLARADRILSGASKSAMDRSMPLTRGLGQTRLRVLLAGGRVSAAEVQLSRLGLNPTLPMPQQLALAYAGLAEEFAFLRRHGDLALKWAHRAAELGPNVADGYYVQVSLYLEKGDDADALAAAQRFIQLSVDRQAAYQTLSATELQWPTSGIWADLRRSDPDYPAAVRPAQPPTTTTGQAEKETGDS